ncbi:MAG: ribonuclease P protein component [Burkholderiaceae bacterium]
MRCLTSLNQPKDFTVLLNERPVASVGPFVFHLRVRPIEAVPGVLGPRLGMVLPKRMVRRAVARNQLKRWIRPLARRVLDGHAVDLLVRVKKPVDLTNPLLKQAHKEELVLTFEKISNRLGPRT